MNLVLAKTRADQVSIMEDNCLHDAKRTRQYVRSDFQNSTLIWTNPAGMNIYRHLYTLVHEGTNVQQASHKAAEAALAGPRTTATAGAASLA